MPPMHRRLADHCLTNPLAAGTAGLEDLARAAGVSNATVNRFTRRLGLDGFAEFRAMAIADIHRLMSPEEKLEAQVDHPRDDIGVIEDSFDAAFSGLARTRAGIETRVWREAVEAITTAERVAFLGFGISTHLLDLFASMIAPFCRAQIVLDGRGGPERVVYRSLPIGRGDLVVAMTLPRYSRATIEHAAQISRQGARVLGITDAATSPLVPFCDLVLYADARHPLLHASPTAAVAVFESLAALLTARGRNLREAAELTRRIGQHLHLAPSGEPQPSPAPRAAP
jgi:DNA-binding MurR/RpiR family transcriptional regulator